MARDFAGENIKDVSRSSSAPPVQLMDHDASDPRMDPGYAAYYHLHSRLDSRLPPPLYSPGQSWQVWAPPGLNQTLDPTDVLHNGPPGLGMDFFKNTDNDLTRPLSRNSQEKIRGFSLEDGSQKFQGSPWNKNAQPDLLAPSPMSSASPSRSDPSYSVKRKPFVDLVDNFERSSSPPLLSFNSNPTSDLQNVFKEEILKGEWNDANDDHSTVMAASVLSSALLESDMPPRAYSTPPTRSNLMINAPDLNYAMKNLDIRNVSF